MSIVHETARAVNLNFSSAERGSNSPTANTAYLGKRYRVYDQNRRRWLTAGVGVPPRIFRSVRNRRRYETNSLNINTAIFDEAVADGVETIEIVVTYRTLAKTITYSASVETIRKYSTAEYLYDTHQRSLAIGYWSVDGEPPELPEPAPEPTEPVPEQTTLFDLGSVGRVGGGY